MRSIESFNVIAVLNLFFWCSRGFLVFDQKYQKPRENQKKTKKTKLQTLTHQLVTTWVLQFCFFVFLVFSRFLKTKKQKNKIADPNSPACTYMGLAILVFLVFFFGFLEVFLVFDQKYQKPRENQKNKKNKIADPNSPACTYMGLGFFVFFVFFCFLEVFLVFDQKYQKPWENKKNRP